MEIRSKCFRDAVLPLSCSLFLLLVILERLTQSSVLSDLVPSLGLMTLITSVNLLIYAIALCVLSFYLEVSARWIAGFGLLLALMGFIDWSQHSPLFAPPSQATTWMLLFLGVGIYFSSGKNFSTKYTSEYLAGAAAVLALTSMLGLVAGQETILDLGPFVTTSFFTSLVVFLLSLSCLKATKDGAVIALLKDTNTPGRFVRGLAVLVLGLMFLVAILANVRVGTALFSSSSDLLMIFGLMLGLMLFVIFSLGNMFRNEAMQADILEFRVSENTAYLKKILEIAPVGIMTVDESGKVVSANPSASDIFGVPSGSLDGTDIVGLIPTEYRQEFPSWWREFFTNNANRKLGRSHDLRALKHDGEEIFIELYLTPLMMSGHRLAVCAVNDVTERAKLYKQLEHSNIELQSRVEERTRELSLSNDALLQRNSELQQFTHAASHDLQTPLRGIGVYAGALKDDYLGHLDSEAVRYVDLIVAEAQRLQRLINDLLVYARIDSKGGEGLLPVDLNLVLAEVEEQLTRTFTEVDFEIESGPLPTVPGVGTLVSQLFYNLIENAVKYRGVDPLKIYVFARDDTQSEMNLIEIRDNGIGISPEHHERIFQVFKRLHHQKEVPGTGIGLSICKRIVERHGGSISVVSESGVGSRFHIKLPKQSPSVESQSKGK